MTQTWTDIMVDYETTHTLPDRGAILQVSAVKFNLHERTVCSDVFDRCMTMPAHRHWSESTRGWWMQQRLGLLQEIQVRAEPWREVWMDFMKFSYPAGHLRFWSKPSHFDYNFTQSYCNDIDMPMPFHYRTANDLNSFLRGLYFPDKVPELDLEFIGEKHNAIYDTFHQIKLLFAHLDPGVEIIPPDTEEPSNTIMENVTDAEIVAAG